MFANDMKTQIIILLALASVVSAEVIEKEIDSNVEFISLKHVFRNGKKILEVATPSSTKLNTTYTVFGKSGMIYKYQVSESGGSFQDWRYPDSNCSIKLHTNTKGVVVDIIIYSKDYSKTIEAFHIKDHRLTPFSDNELKKHRLRRSEK
jgi:hypothetical protein